MTLCPCGSEKEHDDCCGPLFKGAPAPTAEALMRSRYCAYVKGEIDYLRDTMAPEILGEFDREDTESTSRDATWQGLEIRGCGAGGPEDETGTVEFVARFQLADEDRALHELAEFRRDAGRWIYSGGVIDPKGKPRHVKKIGRNEPCPCGSGKKYKKCCGA